MGPRPFGKDQITIHGTLVRLGNEGILLLGNAGIGKSTAALALIADGGKLVADDVVIIERLGNLLFGSAPPLLKGIFAIPGLGIFDVREVIGENSHTPSSVITRCIELGWSSETAACEGVAEFLGTKLPLTYRNVERSHKTEAVFPEIDPLFIKDSQTRFFQRHTRVMATPGAL